MAQVVVAVRQLLRPILLGRLQTVGVAEAAEAQVILVRQVLPVQVGH
jgi:hypothetical protein